MQKKQFDAMLKKLNSNPAIKYAVRNIKVHALQVPNDSRYSEQWHYYEPAGGANLEGAWDITTGKNVNVGVIDTGIVNHENLEGQILPGQNFADGDNTNDDPTDHGIGTHYHGTHVSGTIAANSNHHHVVSGIAWDAKVVPVRVLGDGGSGTFDAVIDGMLWAANAAVDQNVNDGSRKPNQNPVDVMNLSLGGSGDCNVAMQEAVDKIISKGTVIVVAAGNESRDAMYSTPANCKGVITVGATGRSGTQAYYTNTGSLLDIAAPGGDQMFGTADGVLSTTGPGQYEFLQGTSMATPHIVGIVALMRSVNPDLSAKEISEILRSTARGNELGVGLVDATAAVQEAKSRYENKRKIA